MITKKIKWSSNITPIERFFFEKLIQQADYEEIISNRHRTCNGYILISEIYNVCEIAIKRRKNSKRLESLLSEASSQLASSVVSDYVIDKYFKQIHSFYSNRDYKSIEISNLNGVYRLLHFTEIHLSLLSNYYELLKNEILNIVSTNPFDKETDKIVKLIDCLIPYLVYKGYSLTKVKKEVEEIIQRKRTNYLKTFLGKFDFKYSYYDYIIYLANDNLSQAFIESVIQLNETNVEKPEIFGYEQLKNEKVKNLIRRRNKRGFFISFRMQHFDEYSAVRSLYQEGLRHHIITRDRRSLEYYLDYFNSVVISKSGKKKNSYYKPELKHDPIDVTQRRSTLKYSLGHYFKTGENIDIPYIQDISEPIYYYNLALGSKSIENSLLLLWTSLESLIPYNIFEADILNTRYFVGKILGTYVVGRHLTSFIQHFQVSTKEFPNLLNLRIPTIESHYNRETLILWMKWVAQKYNENQEGDPYLEMKDLSPLLSKEFCKLNKKWNFNDSKIKNLVESIDKSKEAIEHQLDRIYLARNQVVHSGKLMKEFTNIWSHLEWYVGKLLAQFIISNDQLRGEDLTRERYFNMMESKSDYLYNFLKSHQNEKISYISNTENLELLFDPPAFCY